ncbi:MAG: 3'-5' exonuclease [Terriglobales bacterium]|jgi:DNA polymerase III epsilon subunit-like protein
MALKIHLRLPGWIKGAAQPAQDLYPPDTPLRSVRYVVIDTEFSSRNRRSNRLLSVGAVTMDGGCIRMGEQFYRVLNPGVEVAASSVVVHQLRPSDIEQGESPPAVLAELRDYIAGAVLVGHFVKLDFDLLRKELQATESSLDNPAICTARVHRWLLQKESYSEDMFHRLEKVDLPALAKVYNIESREAHHALDDAFVTARLWQKMIYKLEARGVLTLAQVLKVGSP